jgi:hypothetical protein
VPICEQRVQRVDKVVFVQSQSTLVFSVTGCFP